MTKKEIERCEKLCNEALREIEESNKRFEENDKANHDCSLATVDLRFADQKLGYARGIHRALTMLNYKSKDMEKLDKLI